MEPHNQSLPTSTHPHSAQTLALITSYAPSLVNFRAALIRALCARGVRVLALAPDFNTQTGSKTLAQSQWCVDRVIFLYPDDVAGLIEGKPGVCSFCG